MPLYYNFCPKKDPMDTWFQLFGLRGEVIKRVTTTLSQMNDLLTLWLIQKWRIWYFQKKITCMFKCLLYAFQVNKIYYQQCRPRPASCRKIIEDLRLWTFSSELLYQSLLFKNNWKPLLSGVIVLSPCSRLEAQVVFIFPQKIYSNKSAVSPS